MKEEGAGFGERTRKPVVGDKALGVGWSALAEIKLDRVTGAS